jgi:hypothetical protein
MIITAEQRADIRRWHPHVIELPSGIRGDYCGNCGVEWPCVQATLLDGLEAAEAKITEAQRALRHMDVAGIQTALGGVA